jgi:hypothetical protein
MVNFLNIAFILCLIGPYFFFDEMASWQQIGYVLGSALWVLNSFLVGSTTLGVIALIMIVVSSIQVVVENLPLRL